ncbi:hypothetical protein GMORB2_2711 [Geosmithia morbida]|uniref:Uncharacterized protein n=1 Tax=Geosmithia morbida TaxID=1094350 RepID=A0A9P5CZN4_9HYPO|nr:uncharacterized protein GMORB2_2711 [Geosmithia morbida]KAF4120707.1 hypothetical protein GMORB2_2711 [Geosmithia morbida]
MAFLEDPRLRQRWNQITHDAETATENAAAGIWSFQQHYVNPCLGSLARSVEKCTAVCLGDVEERRRRQRERSRSRAENMFDFYDDWYEEEEQRGGLLGGWGGEDWDRLLAGTGSGSGTQRKKASGEGVTDSQPRRKRGMSYGTRGGRGRRKTTIGQDSTIIPSTQPIGLLSKLPWRMGGTLRYKPSAADLQDHPGKHDDAESTPLLGGGGGSGNMHADDSDADDSDDQHNQQNHSPQSLRKRSGTTGSGDTSDSYRSRGDLLPSDGEGEEDAIPLDDEVTYDMIRKDDRSSGKTTRSSKGKGPAMNGVSRTVSRTTIGSMGSRESLWVLRASTGSVPSVAGHTPAFTQDDPDVEEEELHREEEEKLARQKEAAAQLTEAKGLNTQSRQSDEPKFETAVDGDDEDDEYDDDEFDTTNYYRDDDEPPPASQQQQQQQQQQQRQQQRQQEQGRPQPSGHDQRPGDNFVPARLPFFG